MIRTFLALLLCLSLVPYYPERTSNPMIVADYEKGLAALLAWREERSNGINGMLGVLFVVRNRAKAGWSQGSWSKIIEAHNQFSSMSVSGDSQTVLYPDPRDPSILSVLQLVDSVYDDTRPDNLTGGALYYADIGRGVSTDSWFYKHIVQSPDHPRTAQIGTTTYFK